MFDPEAKQEITRARPNASCTFLIESRIRPSEDLFASATSKRERLERLTSFYRDAKASIVDELAEAGVEVKDLSSSAQLIATASAEQWRALASRLERNPDVDVLPNRIYTAV
jgi:hypothetical protein